MTGAIILAAGKGRRYGGYKQFETVNNKTILEYTIDSCLPFVDEMVIVVPEEKEFAIYDDGQKIAIGGETRYDSMVAGFNALDLLSNKILIADAVRCNTSARIIKELIDALDEYDYAFPALKSTNTVCKIADDSSLEVIDKRNMWDIQTPTAMKRWVIEDIMDFHPNKELGFWFVYMALLAGIGLHYKMIKGDAQNVKITHPGDLEIFKALLEMKE